MPKRSPGRMMPTPRRHIRQLATGAAVLLFLYWTIYSPSARHVPQHRPSSWPQHSDVLLTSLFLDEDQCTAAFPRLFDSIDEVVSKGRFPLRRTDQMVTGRIKDGNIYIMRQERTGDMSSMMFKNMVTVCFASDTHQQGQERTAALHQLSRALITAPDPIPDTLFLLNIHDNPFANSLSYSRAADPNQSVGANHHVFTMPHFAYWHWMRLPFINSLSNASTQITAIEATLPFHNKIPKAVWRGTPWFGSPSNIELRKNLLATSRRPDTREQLPWADVESLKWEKGGEESPNALQIEDFCKYKYVIYTEGISYSGRLQYHQLCKSVMLTPAIAWLQHTTHLIRPVWSSDLLTSDEGWQQQQTTTSTSSTRPKHQPDQHPSKRSLRMWPSSKTYPAEDANVVFVASDWSDLEATISFLEDHPDLAEGIAERQRDMFFGNGYFSPAAEVCYWRAMIRGWAAVVERPSGERTDAAAKRLRGGEGGGEGEGEGDVKVEGLDEHGDGFWDQDGTQWELWVLDNSVKPQTIHAHAKSGKGDAG